jgi:hypothetical protein
LTGEAVPRQGHIEIALVPRAQLFIVPGATHVTMVMEKSPLIGGVVVDFLDAKVLP